jgi:hypothetical protein
MFSNKRIEELEDDIRRLEKKINVLEDDIRKLSNNYVYVGKDISLQFFAYTVPVKDIVVQLLDLHGLKIAREPATSERFTLVKREEETHEVIPDQD